MLKRLIERILNRLGYERKRPPTRMTIEQSHFDLQKLTVRYQVNPMDYAYLANPMIAVRRMEADTLQKLFEAAAPYVERRMISGYRTAGVLTAHDIDATIYEFVLYVAKPRS